jgi:hypothetical protein
MLLYALNQKVAYKWVGKGAEDYTGTNKMVLELAERYSTR